MVHGKGDVVDVVWINLVPIKHDQGYHVYRRCVWSAFEHLDNNLIYIVFSDSNIVIVIVIEYRQIL